MSDWSRRGLLLGILLISLPALASTEDDSVVLKCVDDQGSEMYLKREDGQLLMWANGVWGNDPDSPWKESPERLSRVSQHDLSDGFRVIVWEVDRATGSYKREETLLTRGGAVFAKNISSGKCARSELPAIEPPVRTLF